MKLLEQFTQNISKYAYTFQIFMLQRRLEIYRRGYEFSQKGGIAIIDRCLVGDTTFAQMLYDDGFISPSEWEVYQSLIITQECIEPDLIVYLECCPKVAYDRMCLRGIEKEKSGYSIGYFEKLHQYYEQKINELDLSILRIDWNQDRPIVHVQTDGKKDPSPRVYTSIDSTARSATKSAMDKTSSGHDGTVYTIDADGVPKKVQQYLSVLCVVEVIDLIWSRVCDPTPYIDPNPHIAPTP